MIFPTFAVSALTAEHVDDWVQQVQLARSLMDTGNLDQAAVVFKQTLDSARSAGDDVRAGVVLQNLGSLLDRKGHARESEKAYLRAIKALTRAGMHDGRLLVRTYVGLVAVYVQTGQYSKAEALIRRVLTDHPDGAPSDKASLLGSLGVTLAHKHRFEEAEQVLRQTARMCASTPGTDMLEVGAIAVANLAGLQMRAGRTAAALASYRQALAVMEGLPSPSPAAFTITLADYAKALRGSGDRNAAETQYRRAIVVAEARLGENHAVLGALLQQYAELVRDLGRKSDARKLVNSARRIQDASGRENLTGHTVEFDALLESR
jgi:tetratricopeptide (TPR) repeat protein